jgi:DNA-binding NtrC family response regulator
MFVDVIAIDDDEGIRWLVEELLSAAGFSCKTSATPEEFEALVRAHQPAAAVIDVNLAGADGIQLARKTRHLLPHAKIIIVTGYADAVKPALTGVLSTATLLEKPFSVQHLLELTGSAVRSRREALATSVPPIGP